MRKLLILPSVLFLGLTSHLPAAAQVAPAVSVVDTTELDSPKNSQQPTFSLIFPNTVLSYSLVDGPPQFKSGEAGLRRFLSQNLRFPPALLRSQGEGRTVVGFIVDVNGDILQPRVYTRLGPPWDDEVMRVVKLLDQKFQPATYNGEPVAAPYSLPVPLSIK